MAEILRMPCQEPLMQMRSPSNFQSTQASNMNPVCFSFDKRVRRRRELSEKRSCNIGLLLASRLRFQPAAYQHQRGFDDGSLYYSGAALQRRVRHRNSGPGPARQNHENHQAGAANASTDRRRSQSLFHFSQLCFGRASFALRARNFRPPNSFLCPSPPSPTHPHLRIPTARSMTPPASSSTACRP